MTVIEKLENNLTTARRVVLLYFSLPDCGVCHAVRPKVEALLAGRPDIAAYFIDLSVLPEATGRFEVFAVPTVLLFIDGRETVRESRYFSMDELTAKIDRYLSLL